MPFSLGLAALRVTVFHNGNSLLAEYAVIALLAFALGLIVLCFVKARTGRAPQGDAGRERSRWEGFLRPR